LQELLAPQRLIFFSSDWSTIGRKKKMDIEISQITGINPNIINGTLPLESASIAQRMSWASARRTTRQEDMAYCLMGLFGVNMPLLYGEGEGAFLRLQKEIMKDSDDETIFAWIASSMPSHVYSGLLATHPSAFAAARRVVRYQDAGYREPFSMTNKGLSITLQLTTDSSGLFRANLHCGNAETGRHVGIYLEKVSETTEHYARVRCHEWAPPTLNTEVTGRLVYVKQVFDQTPLYEPLNPTISGVRLRQLIPTADGSVLRARLMEANIDTARYTAVAYDWGDRTSRQSIWVNNKLFEVSTALFGILQKACTDLVDDLFWVDAICINLASMAEGNHQVRLIHRIYRRATRVVVGPRPPPSHMLAIAPPRTTTCTAPNTDDRSSVRRRSETYDISSDRTS
jgi:hypothetical protein